MKNRNIKLLLLALLLGVFSTTIAQEKGLQERRIHKIKALLLQDNLIVNNNRPKPIIVTKASSLYVDPTVIKSKLMLSIDEKGEMKYRKTPVFAKLIKGKRYLYLKNKLAIRCVVK